MDIKREKSLFRIKNFLFFAAIFGMIRQVLLSCLPIIAIPTGGMDDALMVRGAWAMIEKGPRGWLGTYDNLTLVKGFFFPAFLAAANKIGISYIDAAAMAYTLACILFIIAVSRLFKTKYPLYFAYLFLLFNPAAFSSEVLQRVYRNSLTPAQALLTFGCFFAMYLRRKEGVSKILPWAIGAGLTWASLEHSREDAVWLLPAALVITFVSVFAVTVYSRGRGTGRAGMFLKAAVFLVPAVILGFSHYAVRAVNNQKYGLFSYNELNDSHFADVMKAIYGVKMEGEDIYCVSASRAKLKKIYEVSPSLALIEDALEPLMDSWASVDRTPDDREVEDGWFFWVLREAASRKGFHETASRADQYYGQVAEEIRAAIEDGRLKRQQVMPSALMPPWRAGRFGEVMKSFGQVVPYMVTYQDVAAKSDLSVGKIPGGIARFEAVTGNRAIYPEEERLMRPDWLDFNESIMASRIGRLNRIADFYKMTGLPAAVTGLASWLYITFRVIQTALLKAPLTVEEDRRLSMWLILSGLLGGMLCLFGGVAYNHAASCPSINTLYLCAGYPLILAVWTMGTGYVAEEIFMRKRVGRL